jgi:hypothetical protein
MPFVSKLSPDQLADAARQVVTLRKSGHSTSQVLAALVATFGISESTARRLFRRDDFEALVLAAADRELDVLHEASERAAAEIELARLARQAPERRTAPEQGRILAPSRQVSEDRDAFAPDRIDPRSARERVTGLDDAAFERAQRDAFALEDERRAGYKMHESELSIVATRPSPRASARDGYSISDNLARACGG